MVKILLYQHYKKSRGSDVKEIITFKGTAQYCYEKILFYKKTLENFKVLSIRTNY